MTSARTFADSTCDFAPFGAKAFAKDRTADAMHSHMVICQKLHSFSQSWFLESA